jgi:diketogulonate reductase-like aldo/keto reductase
LLPTSPSSFSLTSLPRTGSTWRANPRPIGPDGIAPLVVETIVAAAQAGFTHFDAAENYRNERSVGAGLKTSGIPREQQYIVSKVHPNLGKVEEEIKRQLELFQTDYLDLYLIHTPKATEQAGISLKEAWERLEKLQEQGLVRFVLPFLFLSLSPFYFPLPFLASLLSVLHLRERPPDLSSPLQ